MNYTALAAIGVGLVSLNSVVLAGSAAPLSAAAATPCSRPAEWGENRQSAERALESGDAIPITAVGDPALIVAAKEYWAARLSGDVAKLLELEISQSDAHLAVEAAAISKYLASDRSLQLSQPILHSAWVDPSNSNHLRVYATVLIRIRDHCYEDGLLTDWVRLDDDWFMLPQQHMLFSAAKKGRPNRGYEPK